MDNIRNFAIIAHVDHGKSTLADRLLELTGIIRPGDHPEQFLDRNPISRERGITIKLAPVRMEYYNNSKFKNQNSKREEINENNQKEDFTKKDNKYILNLIDTPGHVDFSYEVERTLACVEGAILLVDATQGIQAQTIAHLYKALEHNLVIIPVVNKIDLPNAEIKKTKNQIADYLGVDPDQVLEVSAKTGQNVEILLSYIVEKIPPPKTILKDEVLNEEPVNKKTRALIFDSYYDPFRGVIAFVRVFEGEIKSGDKVYLFQKKQLVEVTEVGIFTPDLKSKEVLKNGEIGYLVTNLKDIHLVSVGDTVVNDLNTPPLPGYRKAKPMVFGSIFPVETNDYLLLKKALEKLSLNDSSLSFEPIYSQALGAGFRVGFLGLLHADVVRQRLEREFNLNLIITPPKVKYQGQAPNFLEPWVKLMIITPNEYLGPVMRLCQDHRAKFINMDNRSLISLTYEMPLAEMISNFYDQLKSITAGFASLDWEMIGYRYVDADVMEILLNGKSVSEFSEIVPREKSQEYAINLVKKIREIVPRQQFEVRIQAKYKGKIIAAERIAPFRKDVTQKLYGGDRTRKDKLLEKQKKGKKMMKMIGQVEISKEGFLKLFRLE